MILAVTFKPTDAERGFISEAVRDIAEAGYLTDFDESGRRNILSRADVVLARNTGKELRPEEFQFVGKVRLIQFLSAGLDHIPVSQLPGNVPIAKNAGAYADPMAEHVLAMALAAAKRLLIEHPNLIRGEFNQFTPNKVAARPNLRHFRVRRHWHRDRAIDALRRHACPRNQSARRNR